MAYMRHPHYVWTDGAHMHIDTVAMDIETFDELVAMHWHRMDEDRRDRSMRRALHEHSGNFGVDGIARALGQPSTMDEVLEEVRGRAEQ